MSATSGALATAVFNLLLLFIPAEMEEALVCTDQN